MNKSAIKGFSVRARRKLIEDISQKAYALGIKDTGKYDEIEEFEGGFRIKNAVNQIVYPMTAKKDREKLISEISKKGFEQVIEEVAYTWFNRIIAIRFMEVNEYLPVKVRILSSETPDKIEPDVLTNIYDYVEELELDGAKVFDLKENHRDEELFKYVFVRECNNLGKLMPQVFEAIGDFTELLLPDQLLVGGSVIRDLIESIEEDDFREEVEIIGWMYQYYISEKKDEVFAALKKNKKISKDNIPAATQLFTPKWIVKYMTENSLGRLWQESHPNEELKSKWEYYLEPAEQEADVQKKLDELKNPNLSPEEIKILDPAMGSGHILVYAFDVLFDIYVSRGYSERDIPKLILEKNLYGLDIDDRAAQLASFALLMKGRNKNRRLFKSTLKLNVCSIQESNGFSKEALDYLVNSNETQLEKVVHLDQARYLVDVFKDSKEYGSILHIDEIDYEAFDKRIDEIAAGENLDIFEFGYRNEILRIIPNLVKQAKIMSCKYDAVISNPPYVGVRGINSRLKDYFQQYYDDVKSDLYSVFIERNYKYCKSHGYLGFMTPFTWMFISGYEALRTRMINTKTISSLVQLEYSGFEEATVPICTFVLRNNNYSFKGSYIKLSDFRGADIQPIKTKEAVKDRNVNYIYDRNLDSMKHIPGYPIAFWISDKMINVFSSSKAVKDFGRPCKGIDTGDNLKFLRFWYEVDLKDIGINFSSYNEASKSTRKYYPYNKGGGYRKWYGNNEYVLFWNGDGSTLKSFPKSNLRNKSYYMKPGLTWSTVTSSKFSIRDFGYGYFFDNGGSCLFTEEKSYLLGLLNSVIFDSIQKISPTLNFQPGDIGRVPVIFSDEHYSTICKLADENRELCKADWDSSEKSWDFLRNELVVEVKNQVASLEELAGKVISKSQMYQEALKNNEEEMNSLFIDIYNLNDELSNNVSFDSLSIQVKSEDILIKELISYAVGCLFGRYSIESDGVVFTGGQFNESQYGTIKPSESNILVLSEEDYFENDIVHRFVEFIKRTFGEESLEENLEYITSILNSKSKETPRKVIRNYFIKDFYKDHCKMYKKRPIYWMIDSGKQNGVKALFYMHRYDKSTMARFRTDYLHEIQRYYENDIELTEKTNDKKRVDKLKKKLQEVTEFDKVVAHVAHQQINFNLDDGVEHNYELFQSIEVPQGDGQKPLKANLLAKRK